MAKSWGKQILERRHEEKGQQKSLPNTTTESRF